MKNYMTDYEIEMELDEAEKEYREHPPVNLSYWNAGSEYKEKIKKILKFDSEQDVFDYYYYFPEDVKEVIADKLGFSADDCKNAFFHALTQSTLSISMVSILLSKMPAKLGIITPYYFSVPDCCDALKMDYTIFDDFMENINESFDAELLLQSDCNAFWFTSPLNACSIYFKQGKRGHSETSGCR